MSKNEVKELAEKLKEAHKHYDPLVPGLDGEYWPYLARVAEKHFEERGKDDLKEQVGRLRKRVAKLEGLTGGLESYGGTIKFEEPK